MNEFLVGKSGDAEKTFWKIYIELEDNIRNVFKEIGNESLDWTHMTQDRVKWRTLVEMEINFQAPHRMGNFMF